MICVVLFNSFNKLNNVLYKYKFSLTVKIYTSMNIEIIIIIINYIKGFSLHRFENIKLKAFFVDIINNSLYNLKVILMRSYLKSI